MRVRQAPARRVLLTAGALALGGALGPSACRDVLAPYPLPAGAARFAPPPAYARWWALVEACAGRAGDYGAWSWYTAPRGALKAGGLGDAAGYADPVARRIVVTAGLESDGGVVRHEILHAVLGPAYATGGDAQQHPPAYFQDRCAGVVYCPQDGCADAGPPPAAAPADAPTLPLASLDVRVDALPARVSRTGATWADRELTLVVRATNPTARPVWVPLEAVAARPSWAPTPWVPRFGFRIVPAGQPLPPTDFARFDSTGAVFGDTARRVAFAAGQTRYLVVDWSGRPYAAGDYAAVGVFNTRQTWTPLAVEP